MLKLIYNFHFSHLSNAIVELGHGIILYSEEALCRSLLGDLVLEVPDSIAMSEFIVSRATLRQNATLEPGHGEQEVGVVL